VSLTVILRPKRVELVAKSMAFRCRSCASAYQNGSDWC